jgi:hypothetical protein
MIARTAFLVLVLVALAAPARAFADDTDRIVTLTEVMTWCQLGENATRFDDFSCEYTAGYTWSDLDDGYTRFVIHNVSGPQAILGVTLEIPEGIEGIVVAYNSDEARPWEATRMLVDDYRSKVASGEGDWDVTELVVRRNE